MQPVPKKAGNQALGYSRGGFGTQIHIAVDAAGNPAHCILSGGQAADITYAQALIGGLPAQAVLADKGYDADHLLRYLEEHNIQAVIPP